MALIRFENFEADLTSGELRKRGIPLRLQEQPFKVLSALLEHPGQVVSREELVRRLWPDGTFVDYDRGLNAAVARLRQVLSDSAETPKYVETVARRGYRFVAPVEPVAEEPPSEPAPVVVAVKPPPPPPRRSRWLWVLIPAVLAGATAAAWLLRPRETPPPVALQPVPLTSFEGMETQPTFSPDGSLVAFSWNGEKQDNYDIYVKAVSGGSAVRLTHDPAGDTLPSWSPDGRFIAFWRAGAGLMTVSPTGGSERSLSVNGLADQVAWSPDSRYIAFARASIGPQPPGIYAIPATGGEQRRIVSAELPALLHAPAISPDGQWLAFSLCSGGDACTISAVQVDSAMNPRGPARPLAERAARVYNIAWTAGGDELIFSELARGLGRGFGERLWRMPFPGAKNPQVLGFTGPGAAFAAVARSGARIAYSQRVANDDLWKIERGAFTRSPLSSTFHDNAPEFSPDGKRIAFSSVRSGSQEVWIADGDGSHAVQLTSSKASGSPRWSPDGQWIVYDSQAPDGTWDIYIVNSAGGEPKGLVTRPADDISPTFSRNGEWVYFSSPGDGGYRLHRVSRSGGEPEPVLDIKAGMAFESPDGKSLYYTEARGGCNPVFARPLSGGPERKVVDSVCNRAWAVTQRGIYYIGGTLQDETFAIMWLDVASGKSREMGRTNGRFELNQGLAAAPDGKTFLLSGSALSGADLYLVEGFR